jgi:hypothetical protein
MRTALILGVILWFLIGMGAIIIADQPPGPGPELTEAPEPQDTPE